MTWEFLECYHNEQEPVPEGGRFLKLTISQIAKMAGVSKSTVSRALNNTGYVAERTKQRIMEIVKKYGFVPDSKAVSLSKRRAFTVALVLPSASGTFYGELIKGVEEIMSKNGYFTLLSVLDSGSHVEEARERYISVMKQRRVDGAIIFDPAIDTDSVREILDGKVPVVFLLKDLYELGIDSLLVDNFSGAYAMTEHLIKVHGFKKLAFVKGSSVSEESEERFRGVVKALKNNGIDPENLLVFESDFTVEGGKEIFKDVKKHLEDIEAVFCGNDEMALGVIDEMKKIGVIPGKDIAVVGFDDDPWAPHIDPPLTTVHQPIYELGKIAAQRILEKIEKPPALPAKIMLSTSVVVRKSCGCR